MGMTTQLDRIAAKRAIRYVKRGIFPPDAIDYFTAGRETESKHVADALCEVQQGSSRHCFVEANYGLGKSHMLKVAESLALQRSFAVSWVTVNGTEHAFNHPTHYLHTLLENIRVPTLTARGLVELCGRWLANSKRDKLLSWARSAPWEFRRPIERLSISECDGDNGYQNWYLNRLEGRDLQHKNGRYYFPDFYHRLEATVSLFRSVGYNGVLFLFDELECIATHLSNIRSRLLAYEILSTLVDGRRFPHSMFLFATTEDLGAKIANDVVFHAQYEREYAEGYQFAKKWRAKELNFLPVKAVMKHENITLLMRLRDIHALAYEWQPADQISERFIDDYLDVAVRSGSSQREIVKWFVEILEMVQQHPQIKPEM